MAEYFEKLNEAAKKEAAEAQEFAKQFNKSLDYSDDSLVALEEILGIYSDDFKKRGDDIPDKDIWATAAMFGAYLGEMILKNGLAQLNYRWDNPDNGLTPILYNADLNSGTAPVDKCYKRIVNGPEDNLISYYDAVMQEFVK